MIFAATSRVFWPSYAPKMRLRSGLRPEPRWGSLQRSPDPLAGGDGAAAPSPRTPPPLSASTWPPHFEIASAATVIYPDILPSLRPWYFHCYITVEFVIHLFTWQYKVILSATVCKPSLFLLDFFSFNFSRYLQVVQARAVCLVTLPCGHVQHFTCSL